MIRHCYITAITRFICIIVPTSPPIKYVPVYLHSIKLSGARPREQVVTIQFLTLRSISTNYVCDDSKDWRVKVASFFSVNVFFIKLTLLHLKRRYFPCVNSVTDLEKTVI